MKLGQRDHGEQRSEKETKCFYGRGKVTGEVLNCE